MASASGVISVVYEKNWNNKRFYSFAIDKTWYRCGTKNVKEAPYNLDKGVQVEFTYNTDDKGANNVDLKSIVVAESSVQVETPAAQVAQTANQRSGGKQLSKDDYWRNKELADEDRQRKISFQAAMNTSAKIVELALANDGIALGKAGNARFDIIKGLVVDTAVELHKMYMNGGPLAAVEQAAPKKTRTTRKKAAEPVVEEAEEEFDDD